VRLLRSHEGWEDYLHWQQNDVKILGKIKPKPLKERSTGWWSRRITDEHRLVYRVVGKPSEQVLEILQCRGHYCSVVSGFVYHKFDPPMAERSKLKAR
jgi:toxin YoeB